MLTSQVPDTSKNIMLDDIVISVNKVKETKNEVAQQALIMTSTDIRSAQSCTTADVLSDFGIPVQKSQMGGGSPVLRGFEASRILLVIDGVRLNNLIYRAGHLQDIIKTDNNIIDRIEILFGPASTIYGSDALGGVIHLFTKNAMLASDDKLNLTLNVLSKFASSNNAFTEHLDFNIGKKRFASLSSITYSKFGDLRMGKNMNPFYPYEFGTRPNYVKYLGNGRDSLIHNTDTHLQVESGYSQIDVLQKFLYKQNEYLNHSLNIQYSGSSNIPRYDRLTDPSAKTGLKNAEWYYGPQSRLLIAYDMNFNKLNNLFDAVHLGINYQALEESRHNRNFNSPFLFHRRETVQVIGTNLDLQKKIIRIHSIRFGLDLHVNLLKSTADKENIVTQISEKLDTRYPDGNNTMNSIAIYCSHTWKISDQLSLVDGIRLGYSMLNSTLNDTAVQFHLPYTSIRQKSPLYSGNLGIIYTPSKKLKLSFLISTGFRVPNVDDLSKIFESAPGLVIVPNPHIRPEKTINYELGITLKLKNNVRWENSIFYTDYRDITILDKFQINNRDSIFYDGRMSRVFANQNKDRAYIYGFSAGFLVPLDDHFTWSMGINYTYGRIKTDSTDYPLDHIPPLNAHTSFNYQNKKINAAFFINYSSWKRIQDYNLNGEDNEQYATPDGTPAWLTVNLRMAYQIHKYVNIGTGIDNIFDTQYRTFSSGINSPGRNFLIAIRGKF